MRDSNLLPDENDFERIITFSEFISKSDIIPKKYQGKPSNCFLAIIKGLRLSNDPFHFLLDSFDIEEKKEKTNKKEKKEKTNKKEKNFNSPSNLFVVDEMSVEKKDDIPTNKYTALVTDTRPKEELKPDVYYSPGELKTIVLARISEFKQGKPFLDFLEEKKMIKKGNTLLSLQEIHIENLHKNWEKCKTEFNSWKFSRATT